MTAEKSVSYEPDQPEKVEAKEAPLSGAELEFRCHASMQEFAETEWNGLLPEEHLPYLRWSFLRALETSGCVGEDTGWFPCHLALRRAGVLVAAAPGYLKTNSEGEFVFDQPWAEFSYARLQKPYYPKLVIAPPFTPVTGPRLLIGREESAPTLTQALMNALRRAAPKLGVSSFHVLFPREEQAQQLTTCSLLERHGIQYHWYNSGYTKFEDFLTRYRSKQRTQIRRERKELEAQGLELVTLTGSDLTPPVVDSLYDFYLSTVDKYVWGKRYLNRAFFEEICAKQPQDILAVFARRKASGKDVAGAFNLLGNQRLFGRYWGSREELPFLHFNVCYYAGIDACIERGLSVFEPGAGGDHKVVRGFVPTRTFSFHHLEEPSLRAAVERFLVLERAAVSEQLVAQVGPLRPLPSLE
jgi:predicted N-acyltransferase